MSAVTVTGSNKTADQNSSATFTKTEKSANIATLKNNQNAQPLTAIDTYGNVFEVPDYSIGDILGAIPKHCYKRSAIKGLGYVARDIFLMVSAGYLAHTYIPLLNSVYLRFAAWAFYAFAQSLFGTGLWYVIFFFSVFLSFCFSLLI